MKLESSADVEANGAAISDARRWPAAVWLAAAVVVLVAAVAAGRMLRGRIADPALSDHRPEASPAASDARGELLYQTSCARCHGAEGRGDGESTLMAGARPRDFASERWRFAKTRESIEHVIRHGVPGTTMPAAGETLSSADIRLLAEHVLELSRRVARHPVAPRPAIALLLEDAGLRPLTPHAAPALPLLAQNGATTSLASYRGRTMLLHFWGTSCLHCLAEFPKVTHLAEELESNGLTVLSICADQDDPAEAERVARERAGSHPLYVDADGLALSRFQVQSLPAYVLVDPQGRVVGASSGSREWSYDAMQRLVAHLMKASG